MPVPQRGNFLVGWAGDPAPQRLIENGALGVSSIALNKLTAAGQSYSQCFLLV
jgi:hypothetical protein